MARDTRSFEEQFNDLQPYSQDAVKALLERRMAKVPQGPSAEELAQQAAEKERGSIWNRMKRAGWRGMENLGILAEGAAWLPAELLKLPGSINQAVGGTPGVSDRVKQGAENIQRELKFSREFFREKAGVPKEEHWYPTSERLIPEWLPWMVGSAITPGPYLSPIKKLMAKEAIKPALQGMAKMGGYGAAVSALEELNKPKESRDWWNVPKTGAQMAAFSPLFQRFAGAFEKQGIKPLPEEPPTRTQIPEFNQQVKAPKMPPKGPAPRQPMPPARQIPDYVDVPFEAIKSTGELPHIPTRPLEYQPPKSPTIIAPGPVATGPGTVIEMPGPIWEKPPSVPDMIAKGRPTMMKPTDLIPDTLDVNPVPKDPFLIKRPPDLPPPPKALADASVDALAAIERPSITQATDLIPDTLEVNAAKRDPFLFKHPIEETAPLLQKVDTGLPPAPEPPKPVTPSKVYGPSLVEFLQSKGGVMDQGGELGRLEIPRRPFTRALVRQNGMGLDTAAEIAYEAGYIPRRDVNLLLDALDNESRGNKVFGLGAKQQPALEDALLEQKFAKERPFVDPDEAEFMLTPEEPIHPSDLPDEFLPPLEEAWPDPSLAPRASAGAKTGQQEIDVPPPTAGQRPIIGREVTPEEAPLFSKAAQEAIPEQGTLNLGDQAAGGGGKIPPTKPPAPPNQPDPPAPNTPTGHVAAREVAQEVASDLDELTKQRSILNNERGSTHLGGGVGPVERLLTQRRFAEKHPLDFGPVYQKALDRFEWAAAQKHDLHQLGRTYFLLGESDRKVVDKFLRAKRRGQPATLPPALQPAADAVERIMKSSYDLINDVRATKGLPPITQDPHYIPFARSGDYLTIATAPNGQKWVSAATTLREAEATAKRVEAQIRRQFPGSTPNVLVKTTSQKKGDLPTLDFGTLSLLEKAGIITPQDFEQAVNQFDLPPGFSAHFRHAQKILGESADLLDPIERYIDGVTNYAARFLHDDEMKGLIQKITDPAIRQYAEEYRAYLNSKPQEYSRLRGAVAVWDLSMNVGSILQNASQTTIMGFPVLQREVGLKNAASLYKEGWRRLAKPDIDDLNVLHMAEREGHIRPINAEELFGARGTPGQELEFGSPYVQRQIEKGWLPEPIGQAIRKPLDWAAGKVESLLSKGGDLSLKAGQKLSYAVHKLTGSPTQVALDKAQAAHPVLMQGFAAIEEMNRKWAIITGYRAGLLKGLTQQEAYEFAKKFSRDVNFDYSPASRANLFRGAGAPLGLFMTFQTEAMATYSKLIREQVKQPGWKKLGGAAGTALLGFWTIAGLKGLPAVEDFDLYGPSPGMLSQNLPDWLYQGPASAISGRDVSAKFKLGPRVPYDLLHGEFDPSQIPIIQPAVNLLQGTDWFLQSPMDAPSTQKYIERMLPPAARHLAQAGRWAGMGPAGEIEQGTVGTLRGHTPGPTDEGKRDFFYPSGTDIAGKALTFTPLELSKQYTRGRIQQQLQDRERQHTSALVNQGAHHLDRNGPNVPSPALQELQQKHPNTYKELIKAYNLRQGGQERGSTEEIYRKAQEPKVIAR